MAASFTIWDISAEPHITSKPARNCLIQKQEAQWSSRTLPSRIPHPSWPISPETDKDQKLQEQTREQLPATKQRLSLAKGGLGYDRS